MVSCCSVQRIVSTLSSQWIATSNISRRLRARHSVSCFCGPRPIGWSISARSFRGSSTLSPISNRGRLCAWPNKRLKLAALPETSRQFRRSLMSSRWAPSNGSLLSAAAADRSFCAMKPVLVACAGLLCLATAPAPPQRPVTVDDLMRLRSIADVRISPDGRRIAYVVSGASLEQNAYVPELYIVDATGGTPLRMTHATRIANRPLPRPLLRWSPDGTALSFLALIDEVPQVVVMDPRGGEARPVTSSRDGVANYAWAPDAKRIAFVAPEPASPEEERRRNDKTYVIHVDRDERPTRLWMQDVAVGAAAKALTQ